jgi:hypothetical protein
LDERALYDDFSRDGESERARLMADYFEQAKGQSGGIKFDHKGLWSQLEEKVDIWFVDACVDRRVNPDVVPRAREAVLHRLRDLLAKTIRERLGNRGI